MAGGGGGGGASPALGFFLRGFGFFAFCGKSVAYWLGLQRVIARFVVVVFFLPFLGRGGMSGLLTDDFCYLLSCGCRSDEELVARAVLATLVCCWSLEPLCSLVSSALCSEGRSDRAAL